MLEINSQNEKIKRRFFEYLKESKGFTETTIDKFERGINLWQDCFSNDDFKKFNKDKAIHFKKWLAQRKSNKTGEVIGIKSRYQYQERLNDFFHWLADQPGYKSHILLTDINYLQLDKHDRKIALYNPYVKIPSLEIYQKVINSITGNSEVDRRDKAILALVGLTGIRNGAATSLPLGCLDLAKKMVHQLPTKGVRTKFTNFINTTFMEFDKGWFEIVKSWANFLKKEKLFTDSDPLFPATKSELQGADNHTFVNEKVKPVFWKNTSGIRRIFKKRFKQAGVAYFPPHSVRHLVITLGERECRTPEEFKALSQNVGHKKIMTTFDYAQMSDDQVSSIMQNLTDKDKGVDHKKMMRELAKELKPYMDSEE